MPGTLIQNPDDIFWAACRLAKIPATTRQMRKWKRNIGLARTFRQEAINIVLHRDQGHDEQWQQLF